MRLVDTENRILKKPILNKNRPRTYILENWAIYYI